jgi:hypothetical protein
MNNHGLRPWYQKAGPSNPAQGGLNNDNSECTQYFTPLLIFFFFFLSLSS